MILEKIDKFNLIDPFDYFYSFVDFLLCLLEKVDYYADFLLGLLENVDYFDDNLIDYDFDYHFYYYDDLFHYFVGDDKIYIIRSDIYNIYHHIYKLDVLVLYFLQVTFNQILINIRDVIIISILII